MSAMVDDAALIEQSAQRLFAEQVDKAARAGVEAGAFDNRLWQLAVDHGFAHALASAGAGGVGATWSAAVFALRAYAGVPATATAMTTRVGQATALPDAAHQLGRRATDLP